MSIQIDKALGVHVQALELRMQRSEILAANLANESTPGFQARDIDFASAMRRLEQGAGMSLNAGLSAQELKYRVPHQASQDGNTVELGVEQAEFSRNAMDFQTSLTFLTMKFSGLKKAIEGQ
ncbi:flagellar basal body rod protein FlgB [Halopseudomonas phragmitis]|uniref:Flagellar basal body rod protein FlgB n=2 Tax=Pseudomonadaceae TaxID=135621 RepID=A0A1V0B1I0_9GAMM|nr:MULTISPECIES: flagellar basal body rod protein FlgB [Pseudomonadaceae]AQZ93740.1 flagellar basal-body rod protein FlgB [Halopseudomonas phragmitis]RHW20070.1 flagellar basal body rod protein FlgB [Pseudomonas jilinensis]